MKTGATVISLLLVLNACNLLLGTKDLGAGYYYDINIVLSTTPKYDGAGICIIPAKILSLTKTEDFIIASNRNKQNQERFWIILKKQPQKETEHITEGEEFDHYYKYSNVIGPLNEKEFKQEREKHNVPSNLELTKIE